MRARSASGSVDSPSAVEPTRSQKRTVTTLRCSRVGSGERLRTHCRSERRRRSRPQSGTPPCAESKRVAPREARPARSASAAETTLPFRSWRASARSTAAAASSTRPARCEHLPERRRRRTAFRSRKSIGSTSATASREAPALASSYAPPRGEPAPARPPSRLCVEIVRRRDRPALLGESSGLVVTPLRGENVGEDRVHGGPRARLADAASRSLPRRSSRSARSRSPAITTANTDVARVDASSAASGRTPR